MINLQTSLSLKTKQDLYFQNTNTQEWEMRIHIQYSTFSSLKYKENTKILHIP